jgi:hypothetical protein
MTLFGCTRVVGTALVLTLSVTCPSLGTLAKPDNVEARWNAGVDRKDDGSTPTKSCLLFCANNKQASGAVGLRDEVHAL